MLWKYKYFLLALISLTLLLMASKVPPSWGKYSVAIISLVGGGILGFIARRADRYSEELKKLKWSK
jgi:hypothetical protein